MNSMNHPTYPSIPRVYSAADKKRVTAPPPRHDVTPQGSLNTNYTADRRSGSPFSSSGDASGPGDSKGG